VSRDAPEAQINSAPVKAGATLRKQIAKPQIIATNVELDYCVGNKIN
jgi:hypothetical protein